METTMDHQQSDAEDRKVSMRLVGWLSGIGASVIVAGGIAIVTVLWQLNVSVTEQRGDIRALGGRVSALETALTASTAFRYTSADASSDRVAFDRRIQDMRAIIEKNSDRITALERFQIQIEAAGKKGSGG